MSTFTGYFSNLFWFCFFLTCLNPKSNFKKLRLKQLSPVKSKLFLKVEKNRTLFSRESRLSWLRRAYCPFPLAKPGLLSFFFVRIRNFKNAVFYRLTILT